MPFPLFVLASATMSATTIGATLVLSGSRSLAVAVALLGAGALLCFHGLIYFDLFPVDDAYISFRYSKHFADGLGPNWNSEGRVEGYTSFLWMALVAGMSTLGFDLVDGARILVFASLGATLFFVFRIWKLWADENDGTGIEAPAVLATALVALALVDGVGYWGFSGMETPLFMALLAGGAYLYLIERRSGGLPWSALAFVAAALTRPEGAVAAAVTGAFVLGGAAMARNRAAIMRAAAWCMIVLAFCGSYFLWRYEYYGYLLPNTFYAKVGSTSAVLERGFEYLYDGTIKYHLLAMLGGTSMLLTLPRVRADAMYITALTSAMLLAVGVEGGDSFRHGRFIVPALPLLYLSGVTGFATLLKRLPFTPAPRAIVAGSMLLMGALLLLRLSDDPFVPKERAGIEDRRVLAIWLSDHTPPDYTIAAFAIGSVAYYSERDMLDLFGLNDVVIAHTDVSNFGYGVSGHERYNADYTLDQVRPEIIITGDADPGQLTPEAFRSQQMTPGTLPARTAIMNDPRLWERYQMRALELDGRWFHFLQRTDTIDELQAPGLR